MQSTGEAVDGVVKTMAVGQQGAVELGEVMTLAGTKTRESMYEARGGMMLVDELIGKQEVVIKSLGETFKNVTGIAGGSILGDGRVGLILDVEALFANSARE